MIDLGDVAVLTFQVVSNGSLVDPTTITLTIGLPDGTSTALTPTKVSTGSYRVDYVTVQSGRHDLRWVATGPGASSYTDILNVADARSAALIGLDEFKQHLNMTGNADDDEIRRYLESATQLIERHVGQVVARRSITETHHLGWRSSTYGNMYQDGYRDGYRSYGLVLKQGPVISLTAISSSGLALDPTTFTVDPATGELRSALTGGGVRLAGYIVATYVAGYAVVPQRMILAAEIIAAHLWETQRQPGVGPNMFGAEPNLTLRGFAIPNRAVELLGGRPPVFA